MNWLSRKTFLLLFFLGFFFFLAGPALASDEFETSFNVRYQVLSSGMVHVNQKISLTNKLSRVYATRYSLTLQVGEIENIIASDNQGPLKIETQAIGDQTKIDLIFNEKVVGKDKTLNFNLEYDIRGLANKTGQAWEIIIPKLADSGQIDAYTLALAVPKNLGQPAFISPEPISQNQEGESTVYHFSRNQVTETGVSAAFGQFQVFDFILTYHLKNPHLTPATTEIALPPDTAYQQISYQKIEPVPLNVTVDGDGNWLAQYKLEGSEKLNITATGKTKVFASPQENFPSPTAETLSLNLTPQTYWPVDDPLIQSKTENLKTPQDVYRFVIQTLEYDFGRVEAGVERLGALEALTNPQKAICMEFTDLFITLARAAGIPAREINGYAYTSNPKLKPLSLVTDMLHSWPEYWDENRKTWVPVDPTWEKTTGGVDYFNKIDLSHFAFVIHGQSSETPYPAGSYKTDDDLTKDIQVVFGQYEEEKKPQLEVEFDLAKEVFFETENQGRIIIRNPGPSAVYNLPLEIVTHDLKLTSPNGTQITVLPPLAKKEIPIRLSAPLFKFGEGEIRVTLDSRQFSQRVRVRSLVLERILPLVIGLVLLTFVLWRVKKKLPGIWSKIRKKIGH